MSLTLLFGLMTLAPAAIAILLGILSRVTAFRTPTPVAMGVAALAALAPIIGLILLASDLAYPTPVRFAFLGDSATPFAPLFRADGLSYYGAWGIAAVITPLLLWIVWMDAGRVEDSHKRLLAELGLTIGLEVAALQLVFSDNLLWLALAWLALAALAWLLGEQAAEDGQFDYPGLILMLAGPALTMALLVLIAAATKDHTFYALTGHAAAAPWQIILLAVTLTLAAGGYPFVAWVRRRAAFTTPSGFAALVLLALPVVVFVGARAWGALQNSAALWPEIGAVAPPITGGIALALLGTLTIAISGLLALGRRDGRTLVALLATAQVGWGLLALGSSQVIAGIGAVVLLATSVVGLGAMMAALVAGGVLTADDEPEGAGPAPFGLATRPLNLFAWCIGAATALGVPFFGGFVTRHLITSGTLLGTKLGIPLLGLAWLGDTLFAVALIRATVLAFKADPGEAADDVAEAEDEAGKFAAKGSASSFAELLELPGAVLALIGVALGVFPQVFLSMGALFATDQITHEDALSGVLRVVPFGYETANSQWLPGIFWLVALALGVVVLLLRLGVRRTAVTLVTSGDDTLTGMASDALDEPAVVWLDLAPAFTSSWTQLAGSQLIGGIDEDDEYAESLTSDEDEEDQGGDDSDDSDDRDDSDDSGFDITYPSDESDESDDSVDSDESATTSDELTPTNSMKAADDAAPSAPPPATKRKTTKQGARNADKRGQARQ